MSWKPAVQVAGETGYHHNNLAFATEEEAIASAADLAERWLMVVAFRADHSDQPVNYQLQDGVLTAVGEN